MLNWFHSTELYHLWWRWKEQTAPQRCGPKDVTRQVQRRLRQHRQGCWWARHSIGWTHTSFKPRRRPWFCCGDPLHAVALGGKGRATWSRRAWRWGRTGCCCACTGSGLPQAGWRGQGLLPAAGDTSGWPLPLMPPIAALRPCGASCLPPCVSATTAAVAAAAAIWVAALGGRERRGRRDCARLWHERFAGRRPLWQTRARGPRLVTGARGQRCCGVTTGVWVWVWVCCSCGAIVEPRRPRPWRGVPRCGALVDYMGRTKRRQEHKACKARLYIVGVFGAPAPPPRPPLAAPGEPWLRSNLVLPWDVTVATFTRSAATRSSPPWGTTTAIAMASQPTSPSTTPHCPKTRRLLFPQIQSIFYAQNCSTQDSLKTGQSSTASVRKDESNQPSPSPTSTHRLGGLGSTDPRGQTRRVLPGTQHSVSPSSMKQTGTGLLPQEAAPAPVVHRTTKASHQATTAS